MTAGINHATSQFSQLLHQLDDAVVEFELVDSEERSSSDNRTQAGAGEPVIVDANHAFRDIFSPDMKRVIGLPLNELIVPATRQDEARQFDQRTSNGRSNVAFVERTTTEGTRTFLYRGIPYDDDHGFAIYTDVTGELDHGTELTEIIALAKELRSNPADSDPVDVAAEIQAKAESLAQFTR